MHVNPEMAFQCHVLLFSPFFPQSVIKKKSRKKGEKPNVCMCVCMWVSLAYLLTIGCLRRVARVCKDHPGGYRWILLPPPLKKRKKKKKRKNRTDESHYRDEIRAGFRSLSNSQSLYNIRIMKGLLDTLKKKPRSRIGTLLHLYSQMHTRRWTSPPVRFIDLRRPAADRSAVPPTTD